MHRPTTIRSQLRRRTQDALAAIVERCVGVVIPAPDDLPAHPIPARPDDPSSIRARSAVDHPPLAGPMAAAPHAPRGG